MHKRGSIEAAIFLVVLAFAIIGAFMAINSKNSSSGMAQIAPDEGWYGISKLPSYLPYESPYEQCTSSCMPGGVDYYHCLQSCDAFSSIGNAYAVNPSLRKG